jgi:ribonuclease P protein component
MEHTVSMKENHLFRRLYAKGKSAAAPSLAVYVRPNSSRRNRLGLTVGTKVGKAVCRNKVRRRIREAYRTHESQMAPGWDIVVVARVRSAFASYGEIERDLLRLLDKLGVRQKGEKGK